MNQEFELRDSQGRYALCLYDKERNLLKITHWFYPDSNLPIEEILDKVGYTITSKKERESLKVVPLTKRS